MTDNNKTLVSSGHELASELKADCGAVDMRSVANLLTELASALDVQSARSDALAAENEIARNAVQTFCDVVGGNTHAICEGVGEDGVRVILAAMKATGNMSATDAWVNEQRAVGVEKFVSDFTEPAVMNDGKFYSEDLIEASKEFAAQLRGGRV